MTSARFSRADIREILNITTISDILPCGYNYLRAVRYRDIRENAEYGFLFAALSLRNRCAPGGALSHPSRAECFSPLQNLCFSYKDFRTVQPS